MSKSILTHSVDICEVRDAGHGKTYQNLVRGFGAASLQEAEDLGAEHCAELDALNVRRWVHGHVVQIARFCRRCFSRDPAASRAVEACPCCHGTLKEAQGGRDPSSARRGSRGS